MEHEVLLRNLHEELYQFIWIFQHCDIYGPWNATSDCSNYTYQFSPSVPFHSRDYQTVGGKARRVLGKLYVCFKHAEESPYNPINIS